MWLVILTEMKIYAIPNYLLGDPVAQAGKLQRLAVGSLAYHAHPGDGIIVAEWVEEKLHAEVTALGEVQEVSEESESISIELVPFQRAITPGNAGKGHWRRPRFMRLDPLLVKRYGLIDDFCSTLSNEDFRDRRLSGSARERVFPVQDKRTLNPREGFVYLFKGSQFCKIGMAVDVPSRKAAVEKQCGEKLELVHTIASADYNQAERDLHVKYKTKRVKGEWFDLSPEDISEFCSISEMRTET